LLSHKACSLTRLALICWLGLTCFSAGAASLGTAFTYRGHLSEAKTGASGLYDLRFTLYDAPDGGAIIGLPLTTNGVAVSNGLFSVTLDFGAVFAEDARWLGVEVRTNGAPSFSELTPYQLMTPAIQSLFAVTAGNANYAANAGNALTSTYATNSASAQSVPWSALPGAVLTNAISLTTNATLTDSVRMVNAGIESYGLNRFRWTNSINTLATNGPFRLWMVGNGWALDGEFAGVFTNLLSYKPFAGYGSSTVFLMVDPKYAYGQQSGMDTAVFHNGDDTNWHQQYLSLEATGQITAPCQIVTSDVVTVSYLASSNAGSFVLEVRTNEYNPYLFLQLDSTWTTVASVNASNVTRVGAVLGWTNANPVPTQVRVRATSAGSTPILEFAQWNSRLTNGVILGMYSHGSSGNWWAYTDTNVVFPVWAAQAPTLVLSTGGWGDSRAADTVGTLRLVRSGFPNSDIVDVAGHETSMSPTRQSFETAYCWSNGIPFFNGEAASADAWGSFANGTRLGMYQDMAHLSPLGFAAFSDLVWSWLDLTASFTRPVSDQPYHFDANFVVNGSAVSLNSSTLNVGGIVSSGGVSLASSTLTWQNPPTGTPVNTAVPAAWVAVTNAGLRYFLPLYR